MKFILAGSLFISIMFFSNSIFAQSQLWEIYTTSNQPFINVIVEKYESDSLFIKSMDKSFIIHQDSIRYIVKEKESKFGLGFLFGAIIGGIAGAASTSDSEETSGGLTEGTSVIFGALLGGVLGGALGLAVGSDEEYPVEKLNSEKKTELLNRLFN